MSILKIRTYTWIVILLFLFSTAFASKEYPTNTAAIISSNDSSLAKSTVFNAYKLLTRVDKPLRVSFDVLAKLVSRGEPPYEQSELEKFRASKHQFNILLYKYKLNTGAIFFRTDVHIDILDDGHGNHLSFHLPGDMNLDELPTSINTVESAKNATIKIKDFITRIDGLLPSSTNAEDLDKFFSYSVKQPTMAKSFSRLSMIHTEDSQAILESLVKLKDIWMEPLQKLLNLASLAASGKHTEDEMQNLQSEYFDQYLTFIVNIYNTGTTPFGKLNLFNDVTLSYQNEETVREYFFPKVDLMTLKLDRENFSTIYEAVEYIEHLIVALSWIGDWTLSGNTPLPDPDRNSDSQWLTSDKLDSKTIAYFQSHFSRF